MLLVAATAVAQQPPAVAKPLPIQDNSFLVEEAYNQERGVVQHISTFQRAVQGGGWQYTFTQEWPVRSRRHQLSYTLPTLHTDGSSTAARFGDLALNYRVQARDRGGVLVAPRLTVVLPTGSARAGAGAGGMGVQTNLPLTLELSPRWSTHTNVGGTLVPRGRAEGGAQTRAANVTLAQSVIWLARPTFNVLVEGLWSRTSTRADGIARTRETQTVVSPGVRYAINRPSGMQIVPGLAAPLSLAGPPRRLRAAAGVVVYFSVEHPFAKQAP